MAKVVIRIPRPLHPSFKEVSQKTYQVLREDDDAIFITTSANNSYQGDDESIVYYVSHAFLRDYDGAWRVEWGESEY